MKHCYIFVAKIVKKRKVNYISSTFYHFLWDLYVQKRQNLLFSFSFVVPLQLKTYREYGTDTSYL